MATIAEVAKEAGVGVATVSRVLNGSPAVREQTRARVRDAISRLGYAPSAAARALSTGRSRAVSVVAPQFTRPAAMERLRGVSRVLAAAGYQLVLCDRYGLVAPADGVLCISVCPPEAELERLAAAGVPVVLVAHPHDRVPSVCGDDVAGGRLATWHLLALGHERIAFVGAADGAGALRRAGYEAALRAAGRRADPALVRDGGETAAAAARALLESPDPPTALFAACDTQALEALDAAAALGAAVPGDLSVVGCDGIEPARHAGLTTVAQPLEESGARGATLLLTALEGIPVAGRQLPVELVVRVTTGPPVHNRVAEPAYERPGAGNAPGSRHARTANRVRS
jgi:DNA-binding LacI/PurR family transcriptional regulator